MSSELDKLDLAAKTNPTVDSAAGDSTKAMMGGWSENTPILQLPVQPPDVTIPVV